MKDLKNQNNEKKINEILNKAQFKDYKITTVTSSHVYMGESKVRHSIVRISPVDTLREIREIQQSI